MAKSRAVHARAARLLATEHASKTYLAVVQGKPPEEAASPIHWAGLQTSLPVLGWSTMGGPAQHGVQRLRSTSPKCLTGSLCSSARSAPGACTRYGRTCSRQILAVAGDPIYRSAKSDARLPAMTRAQVDALEGQALHAWRLTMPHPMTGEMLDVTAPVPARLQALGVNRGGCEAGVPGRVRPAAALRA